MNNAMEKNKTKEASEDFQDAAKSGIRTNLIDLEKSEGGVETAMPLFRELDENVDCFTGDSETRASPESLLVDHVSDIEMARPPPLEMNVEDDISAESRESNPNPSASAQGPGAFPVAGIDSSDDGYSIADPSTDNMANETFSPPAPLDRKEIAATKVDEDEEARKRQEQIDKEVEKKLAQEHEKAEVANIVPRFWCTPRAKRCIALGVVLAIVAIVLGIALSRVLAPPTPTLPPPPTLPPTSTLPPTAAPTSPLPGLMELLSSVSFDGGAALETPGTPQNEAVIWLANNTNLGDYSDERKIQRYVLVTLYYSTNGNSWRYNDRWLSDNGECFWYNRADNVFCSNGAVVELDLWYNNLNGTIPMELALLSNSIVEVDLAGGYGAGQNELTGSIPSEIGLMTNLASLYLYENKLTGKIPSEIALMAKLYRLSLSNNSLTGSIPTEIALLSNLYELYLYLNALTGTIPSEVAMLTKLITLELGSNKLTGTILSEIALLTNLDQLSLWKNKLTGTIPTEIAQMTKLDELYLFSNTLTGMIPSEFGLMTNLNRLSLSTNSLTGSIPTEIALLTNLNSLYLQSNTFSGDFTCPDFIEDCQISCYECCSDLNSSCRTL